MATPFPTPLTLRPGEFPPAYNNFQGTVTVGGEPAPEGLLIHAELRWYRSAPVSTFGGRYQSLFLTPNDWALDSQTVTFHLNGLQADETATYNASIFGGSAYGWVTVDLTFPPLPEE